MKSVLASMPLGLRSIYGPWVRLISRGRCCILSGLIAVAFGFGCGKDQDGGSPVIQDSAGALVVVTYGGGDYQRSHLDAFIRPFQESTGTQVESVVWGAEYARLKQMVLSENVTWDVVEVTAAAFARGKSEGLYDSIATSIDSTFFQPVTGSPGVDPFGVPNVYWSTALGYRASDYPSVQPGTWADFFDTKRFPGPRALYDDPRGTLEFALLADGVSVANLYPLDVDRAFRKLDSLKGSVRVWWTDGSEPVRLLLTRQVRLTSAWTGRIYASPQGRSELRFSWAGAAHELDYWVIPKGSRHRRAASAFIRFASSPQPMARQAAITAYGPANRLAVDAVPDSIRSALPTFGPNWQQSFVINSTWWGDNEQGTMQRWLQWRNR